MNLHEFPEDFQELVELAGEHYGHDPSHVEKDYWVTKILKDVRDSEFADFAHFKGGTSLSKAYGLINRFSEDLDMLVFSGDMAKTKTQEKALNRKVAECIVSHNSEFYKPELSKSGGNFRKLYFDYNSKYEKAGIKDQLEVELKACDLIPKDMAYYPKDKKMIGTIIGRFLKAKGRTDLVDRYGLHEFQVSCINPRKTICDKVSRIVKLSYRDEPVEELAKHIRDLYDLQAILQVDEYRQFLLSDEFMDAMYRTTVEDRQMKNSGTGKNLYFSLAFFEPDLIVECDDIIEAYNVGLAKLYFKDEELPPLDEVKKTLALIATRLKPFEAYRKLRDASSGPNPV